MRKAFMMIAFGFAATIFAVGATSFTGEQGDCCTVKTACACSCNGDRAACDCGSCSSCSTCGTSCCSK